MGLTDPLAGLLRAATLVCFAFQDEYAKIRQRGTTDAFVDIARIQQLLDVGSWDGHASGYPGDPCLSGRCTATSGDGPGVRVSGDAVAD